MPMAQLQVHKLASGQRLFASPTADSMTAALGYTVQDKDSGCCRWTTRTCRPIPTRAPSRSTPRSRRRPGQGDRPGVRDVPAVAVTTGRRPAPTWATCRRGTPRCPTCCASTRSPRPTRWRHRTARCPAAEQHRRPDSQPDQPGDGWQRRRRAEHRAGRRIHAVDVGRAGLGRLAEEHAHHAGHHTGRRFLARRLGIADPARPGPARRGSRCRWCGWPRSRDTRSGSRWPRRSTGRWQGPSRRSS